MSTPFDFINAITFNKENLLKDQQSIKEYNAYMVNRGLSYFPDTILYANQMNINRDISPEWQFQFLINSIPKKKRFSKWNKKETNTKYFSMVKEFYQYTDDKTRQALEILTDDQLLIIEEKMYKGGK